MHYILDSIVKAPRAQIGRLPLVTAAVVMTTVACVSTVQPGPTPRAAAPESFPVQLTRAPGVPGDPQNGRQLFLAKGCIGCHTVRGVPGANGVIGPQLTNVSLRPTLAGETIQNSPENMKRWIEDPPAMKPGTAMPKLGLTEQEAQDLSAFLFSQPYNPIQ